MKHPKRKGDRAIIDYIRWNIRSQIFAKSLPMPLTIGNLKRLDLLRTRPELKDKLFFPFPLGKQVVTVKKQHPDHESNGGQDEFIP